MDKGGMCERTGGEDSEEGDEQRKSGGSFGFSSV